MYTCYIYIYVYVYIYIYIYYIYTTKPYYMLQNFTKIKNESKCEMPKVLLKTSQQKQNNY